MDGADIARNARPIARAALLTLSHGLPLESWLLLLRALELLLGIGLALQVSTLVLWLVFGDYAEPVLLAFYVGIWIVTRVWSRRGTSSEPVPREPAGYREQADQGGPGEPPALDPGRLGRELAIAAPVLLLFFAFEVAYHLGWLGDVIGPVSASRSFFWAGCGLLLLALHRLRRRLEAGRG